MLFQWVQDTLWLRGLQAGVCLVLGLLLVLCLQRLRYVDGRSAALALLRGLGQIMAVGALLLIVFRGSSWWVAPLLLLMVYLAARIATRHAAQLPHAQTIALYSIGASAGATILLMLFLGVLHPRPSSLLPIGSMLIANAMNTTALVYERLQAELSANTPRIEAALALGASPEVAVAPYLQAAARAGLLPRLDTLRSLGIVWIPGMMTGMLLAGDDPVQAALYQFVIIALILIVGGLAAVVCTHLIRPKLFTKAEQLRDLRE